MGDEFEARYGNTMRRVQSTHTVAETLERVEQAIRSRGLKLDSAWFVLSACNTAAADGKGRKPSRALAGRSSMRGRGP